MNSVAMRSLPSHSNGSHAYSHFLGKGGTFGEFVLGRFLEKARESGCLLKAMVTNYRDRGYIFPTRWGWVGGGGGVQVMGNEQMSP